MWWPTGVFCRKRGLQVRELDLYGEADTRHPMDVVERLVTAYDWAFDRSSDREIAAHAPGRWCDYSLYFSWNDEAGAMHFSCAFDMRVPNEKRAPVADLLAFVNEKIWMGHFGLWREEGLPLYRHALPLRGLSGPSIEQLEDVIEVGVSECDRFYPAFQYVVWGGKSPDDAVEAAMIDTVGEA